MRKELAQLGLTYLPSHANFVCIFLPILAKEAFEALLQKGIIIRALTSFDMPYAIRVTVGLPAHNEKFLQVLKGLLCR